MRRVAVKIAYLGDNFAGSQFQPGLRTVEGDVISDVMKISDISEDEMNIKCASRTDKGVNALGNVVVFSTAFDDNFVLLKALNAVSSSIYYRSIASVDTDFNPRYANERIYRYVLPAKGIDLDLAKECASLFEGEHDFAGFCRNDGRPTVINMRSVKIDKKDDVLVIEFRSEHFLWNMIRRIVSAISSVGRNESKMDDAERALNGEAVSFGLARADALTLADVVYENVNFITPAADILSRRAEEERFMLALRTAFFDSL
ncbi:MAG: tRNA pseudouridine(38-40) synthase TruA [Methanomassiliicoccaceae archaeon]|nr:tRNA pseudouridine(38-40) synthase TruA [Methanomassiliicoccaceae archaeon]